MNNDDYSVTVIIYDYDSNRFEAKGIIQSGENAYDAIVKVIEQLVSENELSEYVITYMEAEYHTQDVGACGAIEFVRSIDEDS